MFFLFITFLLVFLSIFETYTAGKALVLTCNVTFAAFAETAYLQQRSHKTLGRNGEAKPNFRGRNFAATKFGKFSCNVASNFRAFVDQLVLGFGGAKKLVLLFHGVVCAWGSLND